MKGVETTLPLMRLGDRWKLTIPVRAVLFSSVDYYILQCYCMTVLKVDFAASIVPVLIIQSDLAFGKKGRPASAGKPRIPGGK